MCVKVVLLQYLDIDIVKHLSSIQRSDIIIKLFNTTIYANNTNVFIRIQNDFLSEIDPDAHIDQDSILNQCKYYDVKSLSETFGKQVYVNDTYKYSNYTIYV